MITKLNYYSNLCWYKFYVIVILLSFLIISCSKKDSTHNKILDKVKSNIDISNTHERIKSPLLDSADYYISINRNDRATFYLKKAEVYFRNTNNWEGYVWTLNERGRNYLLLQNKDSAGFYLEKALKLALEKTPNSKNIIANIYYFLGQYYNAQYLLDKSFESYNKALKFWEHNPSGRYICYWALGDFYLFSLKDYKTAGEYYVKALKVQESLPFSSTCMAACYYLIAIANHGTGDFAKADSYIHQAISVDLAVKNYDHLEVCYSAQGILQFDMGKYNEAIESFKKSIKLNIDNKGNIVTRAIYFTNIANTYLQKKQFFEALYFYKKAIPLLEHIDIKSAFALTDLYQNLGQTYQQLNKYDSCLYCYNKCIEISKKVFGSKHPTSAEAYLLMGKFYEKQKQYNSSLYYLQSALISIVPQFNDPEIIHNPKFSQIGSYLTIFEILEHKADIFLQEYHDNPTDKSLMAAYHCYSLCDSLMGRQAQFLEYDNSRLRFIESYHRVYEKYLGCLYKLYTVNKNEKYLSCAFDIMEKNKASILQSGLRRAEALSSIGIPKNIREKMEDLNKKIIYIEKSVSEDVQHNSTNAIQQELFSARRSLEKLKENLEKTYPVYYNYIYKSNQVCLQELKYQLTKKQQLIEYFQGDSTIYVLSVTRDKNIIYKFDRNAAFDSLVLNFLDVISKSPGFNNLAENYKSLAHTSFQLYKKIISPLLEINYLENRQLIIIPDGMFSLVPFDALTNALPNGRNIDFKVLPYLIKSYNISYGYSAELLFNKIYNRKNLASKVLAFSASNSSGQATTNLLSGTGTELNEIKKQMDGNFYFGNNTTENNFKVQSPSFKIIHLALHGSSNLDSANCKIIFNSGGSKNEDGILYDYELYALKLKASLAVLSACETGAGKYYKGEGIFSMARGFIYAGCPAVVMSYWKINDLNTAQQMGFFYRNLTHHKSINNALRNAKLEFLQNADNISAHPVNWASLNAWGKTEAQLGKTSQLSISLLISLLILLILYFITRRFIC